jgi:hypothetical protein
LSRWLTEITARPRAARSSAWMTACSETASSPLVGSSSSSTEASRRIALASAIHRRWPPESRTPLSPTTVS